MSSHPHPSAHERLGRYEILQPLAKGGMAQIHLARFRSIEGFEKLAVVKRLRAEHAESPESVEMFLSEVRLLANMQHPNIVHVYDVGEDAGHYYFAMEYLHGRDLRQMLSKSKGPLPLEPALTVMVGVLAGLHYVHERRAPDGKLLGIVHRDVSPANVLVTFEGTPKILDFGIAKTDSSTHTKVGHLKGKVRYMAPEQVNGETVDRRADVFAAGVVLWELTVGRRLFDAKADIEVLMQIANGTPATPSSVVPAYPRALERIVMKALDRDPTRRYQSAREMQQAIEAFARESKMTLSAVELEAFVADLFDEEIQAVAAARRSGKGFVAHILETKPFEAASHLAPSSDPALPALEPSATTAPGAATGTSTKKKRVRAAIVVGASVVSIAVAAGVAHFAATRAAGGATPSASASADSDDLPDPNASKRWIKMAEAVSSSTLRGTPAPPSAASSAPARAPFEAHERELGREAHEPLDHGEGRKTTVKAPTPAAAPAAPSAAADAHHAAPANCEPPYTVDSNGIEHFKPGCL